MGLSPASALLCFSLSLFAITVYPADLTDLVFKGCATQRFDDPSGVSSQTPNTLFDELQSHSSTVKFYNTTASNGQSAITGLFQCRGDLSSADCNSCVSKIPEMACKRCGKAIAVRIQLMGRYLRYEISGFKQILATELLCKLCGSSQASDAEFGSKLDSALGGILKGVVNGFYTSGFEFMFVLGQCGGDLGTEDCLVCLKERASENVKSACWSSVSGQWYL